MAPQELCHFAQSPAMYGPGCITPSPRLRTVSLSLVSLSTGCEMVPPCKFTLALLPCWLSEAQCLPKCLMTIGTSSFGKSWLFLILLLHNSSFVHFPIGFCSSLQPLDTSPLTHKRGRNIFLPLKYLMLDIFITGCWFLLYSFRERWIQFWLTVQLFTIHLRLSKHASELC